MSSTNALLLQPRILMHNIRIADEPAITIDTEHPALQPKVAYDRYGNAASNPIGIIPPKHLQEPLSQPLYLHSECRTRHVKGCEFTKA
jgi:hypothetical protein